KDTEVMKDKVIQEHVYEEKVSLNNNIGKLSHDLVEMPSGIKGDLEFWVCKQVINHGDDELVDKGRPIKRKRMYVDFMDEVKGSVTSLVKQSSGHLSGQTPLVEPELRTIIEMANNRTMEELLQAPTEGSIAKAKGHSAISKCSIGTGKSGLFLVGWIDWDLKVTRKSI
nr:hypothetical protein [Tanacetum cinerariifolium]